MTDDPPSEKFKRYLDEVEATLPERYRRVGKTPSQEAWWLAPLLGTLTLVLIIAFVTWRMR